MAVFSVTLCASPQAAALEPPEIQCKAALLVDAHTGAIVYAKNEHQELYPASLTKIMTCLLALEAIDKGKLDMNQVITVTASSLEGLSSDGSTANIQAGEVLTVENLLYCMMLVSANEACHILAEAISGSVAAFVGEMNAKAEALGCVNTHFVNPHGLHDSQHYTSAWDMYLITQEAMKHERFMTICDTPTAVIPATNLSSTRTLRTTNCLVSTATRGTRSFVSVVLGGDRVELENNEIRTYSFYDTNQLFNWAFDNFTYQTLLEDDDPVLDVAVSLSEADHVIAHPARDVEILLPSDVPPDALERTVSLVSDPVEAPVAAGDVLGTMTLSYNDVEYATVDLLALYDVEASRSQVFLRDLRLFFGQTPVKVAGAVLAVLVLLFAAWKMIFSRRRYRYGRSVGRGRKNSYRGRRR